jgi:hypothetical protein
MGTSIYSRKNIRLLAGFVVLASLIMAYVMYKPAVATHTPADKAVARGSTAEVFGPGTEVILLTTKLRSSKPSDLMIHATYECSIFTQLVTGDESPATTMDSATASGEIVSWVEIDDDPTHAPSVAEPTEVGADDTVVPISSESTQSQSPRPAGDKALDSVTFCDRTYQRNVQDREADNLDRTQDFIDTKTANAFNWVQLNMQNGIWYVRLMADLTESTSCPTTDPPTPPTTTCAEAEIGNRTLIVEPAKLANDISI